MSKREDVVGMHRSAIRAAAVRNKARSIALVGSVARGDDAERSDYDFLVDFDEGVTLFDIGGLKADLEELLGAEVDVVPRSCVAGRYRTMFEDAIQL
ncbi:nucleotidyltransferase family protein [Candidatus Poriferisodalis sp.]|uniref:nucleotidyltransferase family protein n=1 Tax=Candidatus Poriferisodalis sp. TaxID=3101277 RepID=UPI003B028CB3